MWEQVKEREKERRTECMRALAECGVAAQKAPDTLASAFLERLVRAIERLCAQADKFLFVDDVEPASMLSPIFQ